ncbi:CPBP family intramembrane metalloprotease [bacterium]|nr:CPBP family intramembrane metalloprotease [candidate division CSSED10-310 bacterium]
MDWFRSFAIKQPGWFSLLITVMILVVYIIAGILAALVSTNAIADNLIQAFVRVLGAIAFAVIVFRFGWQHISGLRRLGSLMPWLAGLSILGYEFVTHVLPLAVDADFGNGISAEAISVALNALATGPLEEIPFRGLILIAFVQLWAFKKNGIIKSVIAGSFFFGASHLIHLLLGRPFPQAMAIVLNAFLAGIYYSAIVLRWKTIWPAVTLHSLLNALVAIVAFHTPGFKEPADVLFLAALLQIPVVIAALFILWKIRPEEVIPSHI